MINTVQQALEDVYVALGGQEDIDRLTVSQVLAKIYNVLGGTGDHGQETVPQLIDLIATVAPSGGGGGGTTFPTFTENDDVWTCDLTYAQTYAVLLSDGMNDMIPCAVVGEGWTMAYYVPNDEEIQSVFEDIPETVNYGFRVIVGQSPLIYYADDGNIYAKGK